jgi:hypothetical protein
MKTCPRPALRTLLHLPPGGHPALTTRQALPLDLRRGLGRRVPGPRARRVRSMTASALGQGRLTRTRCTATIVACGSRGSRRNIREPASNAVTPGKCPGGQGGGALGRSVCSRMCGLPRTPGNHRLHRFEQTGRVNLGAEPADSGVPELSKMRFRPLHIGAKTGQPDEAVPAASPVPWWVRRRCLRGSRNADLAIRVRLADRCRAG